MKAHEAVARYGSVSAAARALGMARSTLQNRLDKETRTTPPVATAEIRAPFIPSADLPIDAIRSRLREQFETLNRSRDAEVWAPVVVSDPRPIGVLWFGDPHLGDNGCHWPLLERHVELCRTTEGLYGANIGDTMNNWPTSGRLAKKWADQDTSLATEQRLARWFLTDSGVKWLVWLIGNHDAWNHGSALLRAMNVSGIYMQDWEARFALQFPGGEQIRVHASHDFAGHSQWNILHGPLKAAYMSSDADLYVCGHKHDWGISQFEVAGRHKTPTLIRARGYKFHDEYARVHGFQSSQSGAAILTIFNVGASDPAGRILAFSDVEAGAAVLGSLRRRSSITPSRASASRRPAAKAPRRSAKLSRRSPSPPESARPQSAKRSRASSAR